MVILEGSDIKLLDYFIRIWECYELNMNFFLEK